MQLVALNRLACELDLADDAGVILEPAFQSNAATFVDLVGHYERSVGGGRRATHCQRPHVRVERCERNLMFGVVPFVDWSNQRELFLARSAEELLALTGAR